jgi:Bacterial extracellular solute-binding protein
MQTGHKVKTTVAAPGEIVAALQAGGQADVVVVTNGALAELEDKGLAKNMIPSGRLPKWARAAYHPSRGIADSIKHVIQIVGAIGALPVGEETFERCGMAARAWTAAIRAGVLR